MRSERPTEMTEMECEVARELYAGILSGFGTVGREVGECPSRPESPVLGSSPGWLRVPLPTQKFTRPRCLVQALASTPDSDGAHADGLPVPEPRRPRLPISGTYHQLFISGVSRSAPPCPRAFPPIYTPARRAHSMVLTDAMLSDKTTARARASANLEGHTGRLSVPDVNPATFPDPYPSQPWTPPVPALSSGSSSSTRSSAYTSPSSVARYSGDSADMSLPRLAAELESLGLTAPDNDLSLSGVATDPLPRWPSQTRSRTAVAAKAALVVDYPDVEATTDDETDEEDRYEPDLDAFPTTKVTPSDERTAAAVVADEGRGAIVYGERLPVHKIPLVHGATHLLLSSSASPNSLPPFLLTTLPTLSSTLLALDISANFLMSLPASLATLSVLEELNVSSNPLRALPSFLTSLHRSLRVLIADSAGLTGLPTEMACMKRLNTLSLRRNKMHAVPDCIAGMDSLEDLKLEDNRFLGPWKALVEPLTPLPYQNPQSAGLQPRIPGTVSDEDSPLPPEEEQTIRAPLRNYTPPPRPDTYVDITRKSGSPRAADSPNDKSSLTRTRTIPSRSPYARSSTPEAGVNLNQRQSENYPVQNKHSAIRRMKSANELRDALRPGPATQFAESEHLTMPDRRHPFGPLAMGTATSPPGKFGSISSRTTPPRQPLSNGMFDTSPENIDRNSTAYQQFPARPTFTPPSSSELPDKRKSTATGRTEDRREGSTKGKWGFLKKMSMGRLKPADVPINGPVFKTKERPSINHITSTPLVPRIGESPELPIGSRSADQSRANSSLAVPLAGPSLSKLLIEDPSGPSQQRPAVSPSIASMRRRSFLPIDIPPPSAYPISPTSASINSPDSTSNPTEFRDSVSDTSYAALGLSERHDIIEQDRVSRAKRSLMAYLQDMLDLNTANPNFINNTGGSASIGSTSYTTPNSLERVGRPRRSTAGEIGLVRGVSEASFSSSISFGSTVPSAVPLRASQSTASLRDGESGSSSTPTSLFTTESDGVNGEERRGKDDRSKRAMIIREIVQTEKTYVAGLHELTEIYVRSATQQVTALTGSSKETVVPAHERKIVFSGIEALYTFHNQIFLPALEHATSPLLKASKPASQADEGGTVSSAVAHAVANAFVSHAAFMKMYSSYINNFDSATQRLRSWTAKPASNLGNAPLIAPTSSGSSHIAGIGITGVGTGGGTATEAINASNPISSPLSASQRKRVKSYLKRCRLHPRHSQLNLEGYLLLPVQRIPRYRLLLEELVRSTPPVASDGREDALDRALTEISSLAVNMNEGKRESESMRKLVQWQSRIKGKFPSPLVQPHRRLIMDGPLHLTKVVRRSGVPFEVLNSDGDNAEIQVECLTSEETPRDLVAILCSDLLVLCKDLSIGQQASGAVELWAVLRMQTLTSPASVVHGSTLRIVDNKAILYFNAPSTSDALTWSRAVNLHIPASKT